MIVHFGIHTIYGKMRPIYNISVSLFTIANVLKYMPSKQVLKKTTATLFLALFTSVQLFGFAAPTAEAFIFSKPKAPSTKQILDDTMDYFGVPKDQRTFGVADRKAEAPKVHIVFSPTDPKPGEEVTATAYTEGFRDDVRDQYYTWYLRDGKHSRLEKNIESDTDDDIFDEIYKNEPDAKGMYETMESYKRDAHRIIAASQTLGRFSAKGSDGNTDGYKASLGGHSQQKTKNDYCYMYDFEDTGIMYELGWIPSAHTGSWSMSDGSNCNGDYEPACVSESTLQCAAVIKVDGVEGTVDAEGAEGGDGGDGSGGDGGGGGGGGGVSGEITGGGGGGATMTTFRICEVVDTPTCVLEQRTPSEQKSFQAKCESGIPVCALKNVEQYYIDYNTKYGTCNNGLQECRNDISGEIEPCRGDEPGTPKASCGPTDPPDCTTQHGPLVFGSYRPDRFDCFTPLVVTDPADPPPPKLVKDPGLSCTFHDVDHYIAEDVYESQCISIEKGPKETTHLFPQPQISDKKYKYDFVTGDGSFGSEEEKYWGTDPNNPMSSGNGKLDEENIVGRGVNEFTWIYEEGDEIGVVAEGSAHIRTAHDDASFATMFAFLNNRCDIMQEDIDPDKQIDALDKYENGVKVQEMGKFESRTGVYTDDIRGNNTRFDTINMDREDLTKCLFDNFTPVGQGGKPGKMDITLSFTPDKPSSGYKESKKDSIVHLRPADEITMTAQIENSQKDLTEIHFSWCAELVTSIKEDRSSEPLQCYTETSAGTYQYIPGEFEVNNDTVRFISPASTAGDIDIANNNEPFINPDEIRSIGMASIAFSLNNVPEKHPVTGKKVNYLKVRVEAGENFTEKIEDDQGNVIREGEGQGGYAIAYIPVQRLNNTYLQANTASSNDDTTLSINTEICDDTETNNILCRVGKNEIVGLSLNNAATTSGVSDVKFSIEDAGSTCIDQCAKNPDNEYFFAATGGTGETITAMASYTDIESGEEFNLTRTFVIADPYIEIIPVEGATRKALGAYIDLDGKEYIDESESVFETTAGSTVVLEAIAHPAWGSSEDFYWEIDGETVASQTITFPVDESVTNVTVQTAYIPDQEQKNALEDHFNLPPLYATDRPALTSAQIVPKSELIVHNGSQKIFANISENAPSYILFIIRTFLMIGLIIFITTLIFGIAPRKSHI